jgi:hypothetical protein
MRDQSAGDAIAELLRRNPELGIKTDVSATVEQRDPLEHAEQCAVIEWARDHESQYPELGTLYAIPNGGYRHPATAAALVKEGVRSGIPDLCLPIARRGFNACYIEMKRIGGRPSPAQLYMIELLREHGNQVQVCFGAGEAIVAIRFYLGGAWLCQT